MKFTAEFYAHNRKKLIEKIDRGLVVVAAYDEMQRSNDASFRFEQEANFWYLTGIERAGWRLIMDVESGEEWLVRPQVSEVQDVFDGSLTTEEATRISGVSEVLTNKEASELLQKKGGLRKSKASYVGQPHRADEFGFTLNPSHARLKSELTQTFDEVQDVRNELVSLRAIKLDIEIEAIQQAIDVTIATLRGVYARMNEYSAEYEIEADITHGFRSRGATGHAYDPIVARDGNACTLHYVENNAVLNDGGLVLMDVGAQVQRYAADITRTYAHGDVGDRMRAVHAAVQSAHKDIIELLGPGVSVREYHEKVDVGMKRALRELDLISGDDDSKYRTYFPHAISHGLGLDVHDELGRPSVFVPGMVLTVEPGIYIPEEGIGVRIEDDILITESGVRNLSAALPTDL